MNVRYITIEREYGSGGTKIAKRAAEQCGIACYGREIMEIVAKNQDLSVADLEDYEESVSSSLMYSMLVMSQSQTCNPDLLSNEAKLFVAETRVIKDLASNSPAIFVGHCASQVLKDQDGVLRVFIHANEQSKKQRILKDYGIPERDVASTCRRYNKKRANYYAFCTQKKWTDPDNYDIILDSSTLGIDSCSEVLAALYNQRNSGNG